MTAGAGAPGGSGVGTGAVEASSAGGGGRVHKRRLRLLARQWPTVLLLALLWVLLWGTFAWGTLVAGLLVGVVVVTLLPLPSVGVDLTFRPRHVTVLAGRFVADLVVASFQVAWSALRPGPQPRGGVVAVPLRPAPDVLFAMTAELSSLVPGSLVVEVDTHAAVLYLHVLDLAATGGAGGVREQTLLLEERVLRSFASREDLARAGLHTDGAEAPGAARGSAGPGGPGAEHAGGPDAGTIKEEERP